MTHRARGVVAGAVLALAVGPPTPLAAQTRALGLVTGPVQATQLGPRGASSESHAGFMVGAWTDQQTPASAVSVTAEAFFVRRGGVYPGAGGRELQVDTDYLSAALLPTLRLAAGPVALVAFAGPSVEIGLRGRASLDLGDRFDRPTGQVFAVLAGGGLEVRRGRATLRLEGRLNRQLSDAFEGDAAGIQHRSTEILFRVGMRPRR